MYLNFFSFVFLFIELRIVKILGWFLFKLKRLMRNNGLLFFGIFYLKFLSDIGGFFFFKFEDIWEIGFS